MSYTAEVITDFCLCVKAHVRLLCTDVDLPYTADRFTFARRTSLHEQSV